MERIIALWLNQGKKTTTIETFEALLNLRDYCIGFIPEGLPSRYMLIRQGSAKGFVVNATGTWSTKEDQFKEQGEYFLFDTKAELYEWMKG